MPFLIFENNQKTFENQSKMRTPSYCDKNLLIAQKKIVVPLNTKMPFSKNKTKQRDKHIFDTSPASALAAQKLAFMDYEFGKNHISNNRNAFYKTKIVDSLPGR